MGYGQGPRRREKVTQRLLQLHSAWRPSPLLEDRPPCIGFSDDDGVTVGHATQQAERALTLRPDLLWTPAQKGSNG